MMAGYGKVGSVDDALTRFYRGETLEASELDPLRDQIVDYYKPKGRQDAVSPEFLWFVKAVREFVEEQTDLSADRMNRARWDAYPKIEPESCFSYIPNKGNPAFEKKLWQ